MRRTGAQETIGGRAQIESNVLQHLSALRRELGDRVLRRNYPEGWGGAHEAVEE
jgi:hypothetical protein